jgi:hypothetical protein
MINPSEPDFSSGSYYLIENRQRSSPYDYYVLPSNPEEEGLLVWAHYHQYYMWDIDLFESDDNFDDSNNYFPGANSNIKIFRGDGGGGFVINGKSGSAGNYTYNVSFFGDGSQ